MFGWAVSGSDRREVAHNGMVDLSGLGTSEDESALGGGLRIGGLDDLDNARWMAVAEGTVPGPPEVVVLEAERFGLRSTLPFRDRDAIRGVEGELRGRREDRTGEVSREDITEGAVGVGMVMPGTTCENLGSCDTAGPWIWDLKVERGTSIMSLSLADRRGAARAAAASSVWATLDPPAVPLGGDLSDSAAMTSAASEIC